jgi:16S rRNA (guanine966-N2)-methyltransferase
MTKGNHSIRINAGVWRSRVLKFPDVTGLRPTPDRVRQTLFNWLGQNLHGLKCLDLFAGTGVMGFEALSRGASHVVLVENSDLAYKSLLSNRDLLGASDAHILKVDAMSYLAQSQDVFDVIFLDPPYGKGYVEASLPLLKARLSEQGLVYLEAEFAFTGNDQWQVMKSGKAGQVFYHLLKPT